MNAISAVVITYNEANVLPRCLESLRGIVDEIVIVDAESNDNTVALSREMGARVIIMPWKGYGANKNTGIERAQYDWILSIDADEWIDTQLAQSIVQAKTSLTGRYLFIRQNIYCDKVQRFGAYKTEKKLRLFNRTGMRWNDKLVHETLVSEKLEKKTILKGRLMHELSKTKEDLVIREMKYAELAARQWRAEGYSPSFLKRKLGGVYHFMRSYFFHLGCLAGFTGLEISKIQSMKVNHKIKMFESLK